MFGKGSSKRAEWEGVKEGEGVEEVGEAVKKVEGERALDAAVEEGLWFSQFDQVVLSGSSLSHFVAGSIIYDSLSLSFSPFKFSSSSPFSMFSFSFLRSSPLPSNSFHNMLPQLSLSFLLPYLPLTPCRDSPKKVLTNSGSRANNPSALLPLGTCVGGGGGCVCGRQLP